MNSQKNDWKVLFFIGAFLGVGLYVVPIALQDPASPAESVIMVFAFCKAIGYLLSFMADDVKILDQWKYIDHGVLVGSFFLAVIQFLFQWNSDTVSKVVLLGWVLTITLIIVYYRGKSSVKTNV